MKWFPFLFIFLANIAWAQKFEFKTSQFLKREVLDVLRLLPSDYLQSVKETILIEEKRLESDKLLNEQLCEINSSVIFGQTSKQKISISSKLVSLAQSSSNSFECSHGSFRKLLAAVIIHELTHIKDNKEKISLSPDFQRIVGMKKVGKSSKKKIVAKNVATSPDAYEFKNLEEALAVNAEYMVLDPEFECRRPATANFLSERLGIQLHGKCSINSRVLVQSAYLEDNYLFATDIDPSRIYQIHYLFAGEGKALMSRWGHAMFRLVLCSPVRKEVGPECMEDVSHHVVLSYRAYMNDLDLSYVKGLFGKYPSQLFIMRYLEIQQEYTKFDLRDLYSVPLKMTKKQKEDFVHLTLERYWTYQGKYYFFNNNCGTETQKHLAMALNEEQSSLIHSITPLKMYKDIVKAGNDLTTISMNELTREEMVKKNLLIKSMYDDLKSTYDFLMPHFKKSKNKSFDSFLKTTKASVRYEDYHAFKMNMSHLFHQDKKRIIMKFAYLERYLSSRYLMNLPATALGKIERNKRLKEEVLNLSKELQNLSLQPWDITKADYGIPLQDEFEEGFEVFKNERLNQVETSLENQLQGLTDILNLKEFETELLEVENLKKNKILMNELLKSVNNF